MRTKEADRLSTLRLINAAIKDRDIAARGEGDSGGVGDDVVLAILGKMVKQRHESARAYEEGGRLELAEQGAGRGQGDRGVPAAPAGEAEAAAAVDAAIAEIGADLDPRHGPGDGGAEGAAYRADGFRPRRPDGEGPSWLSANGGRRNFAERRADPDSGRNGPNAASVKVDELRRAREVDRMLAQTRSQQSAARLALEAKRGRRDPRRLAGEPRDLFENLTESELEEFAWPLLAI